MGWVGSGGRGGGGGGAVQRGGKGQPGDEVVMEELMAVQNGPDGLMGIMQHYYYSIAVSLHFSPCRVIADNDDDDRCKNSLIDHSVISCCRSSSPDGSM